MIQLLVYELKKLFKNKALLLILLGIIMIPPFFVPELDRHNRSNMTMDRNGILVPQYQKLEQEDLEYATYTGDLLDDLFFQRIEEDYVKDQFLEKIDPKKIEAYYGKKLTYDEVYQKIDLLDERFFYDTEEEYRAKNGYHSSVIYNVYHLRKNFDEYKQSYHTNQYGDSSLLPKCVQLVEEKTYKQMRSLDHLYVGRTLAFQNLFSTLNIVAFVLSFFFLFLTPSMINKEGKALGLLKTTKYGKRQLALVKMITIVLLSTLIPLVCTLFTTLIIHIRYGLYNWHGSAMLVSNSYLFYSIFTLYIKRLFLMMLGCFGMGVIGTFLSSLFKNSYVSLGMMIVFYLTWMFSSSSMETLEWKTFTPMNILLDSGRGILEGMDFCFRNHLFSLESVVYLFWVIVSILLFYLTYIGYKRRQITNES